ncbi:uncharacterized protein LOC119165802 isoform X1 [Rhipicephalus microplus]|uniref:uncharacterized protein LOC119165802 isoform X1 n=1 Tax=Rhipicephalus microplus TaxID=6941 RepID=UPI003F6CD264
MNATCGLPTLAYLFYIGLFLPPLYNGAKFDVCEEKTGMVQKAKATQLAAKLVDKCALPVVSKYKFSTKMIQKAASKMCVVFRFCFHKYISLRKSKGPDAYREEVYECVAKMASVFTAVLNPDWIDATNLEDPRGLYHDGVNCSRKHSIFTEDSAIALAGIKWVRDTLF